MTPPDDERRPGVASEAASQSFPSDRSSLRPTDPEAPFDLLKANRRDLDVYFAGRHDGYLAGHEDGWAEGWAAADEKAAELHRRAAQVVAALADVPARHPEFRTATDAELRTAAQERRRRSIERFRADHARRRGQVAS